MAYANVPDPPSQVTIIDPFSLESPDNANNVTKMMIPNIGMNPADPIETGKGIVHSPMPHHFELSSSGSQIIVTKGICIIKNLFIETQETYYIDTANSDFYIYGDTIPGIDGDYTIIVCLQYEPSVPDPNAYLALIRSGVTYSTNEDHLVVLGIVYVSRSGGVFNVDNIDYYDSTLDIGRDYPVDIIDGGVINGPIP